MTELLANSMSALVGVVFLLGLLVGSFLNVVIHRLPIMLERSWRREALALDGQEPPHAEPYDLVRPRSACPGCKAPITAMQNVPVVSWLALKGRCANCRNPISARYPLVEAFTALLSAARARAAKRSRSGWSNPHGESRFKTSTGNSMRRAA